MVFFGQAKELNISLNVMYELEDLLSEIVLFIVVHQFMRFFFHLPVDLSLLYDCILSVSNSLSLWIIPLFNLTASEARLLVLVVPVRSFNLGLPFYSCFSLTYLSAFGTLYLDLRHVVWSNAGRMDIKLRFHLMILNFFKEHLLFRSLILKRYVSRKQRDEWDIKSSVICSQLLDLLSSLFSCTVTRINTVKLIVLTSVPLEGNEFAIFIIRIRQGRRNRVLCHWTFEARVWKAALNCFRASVWDWLHWFYPLHMIWNECLRLRFGQVNNSWCRFSIDLLYLLDRVIPSTCVILSLMFLTIYNLLDVLQLINFVRLISTTIWILFLLIHVGNRKL